MAYELDLDFDPREDDAYWDYVNERNDHGEPDGPEGGICTACGEECGGKVLDEGIGSYEYWGAKGVHHDYRTVSDCCEEDIAEEGSVVVDETKIHMARKDHLDSKGQVIVHAGHKYRRRYFRSWFVDRDGERKGVVHIEKLEVA